MKNYIFYSFFFVLSSSFGQQGKNIDLNEVPNTASAIPKIYLNDVVYSFRERDTLIKKVLRSVFWKDLQFEIPLEDYETGKKYLFESKSPLKASINNIELTKNHLLKSFIKIRKQTKNIIKGEIRNDQEKTNFETSREKVVPIEYNLKDENGEVITSAFIPEGSTINSKKGPITYLCSVIINDA